MKKTTMKRIVWFIVINSVAWVWCSYILAWFEKINVVGEISKLVVTEIIAVIFLYAVKSLFENLSKNNAWPDKPCCDKKEQSADVSVEEILKDI
jgi:hypothetical protein